MPNFAKRLSQAARREQLLSAATAYTYSQMKMDDTPEDVLEAYLDGITSGFEQPAK